MEILVCDSAPGIHRKEAGTSATEETTTTTIPDGEIIEIITNPSIHEIGDSPF
jgi:hypothetical protein